MDLREPNQHISYKHFKMEGHCTIEQLLRCNDLITKVDFSDFYMHLLIGKADCRYMQFVWESTKYQMMAPVIRYLRSCGLQLSIYIDDVFPCPDLTRKVSSKHNCWWIHYTSLASAFILINVK